MMNCVCHSTNRPYCCCCVPLLTAATPDGMPDCMPGKTVSPGELLTALEGAPLDTVYLDAACQEKGEC